MFGVQTIDNLSKCAGQSTAKDQFTFAKFDAKLVLHVNVSNYKWAQQSDFNRNLPIIF